MQPHFNPDAKGAVQEQSNISLAKRKI